MRTHSFYCLSLISTLAWAIPFSFAQAEPVYEILGPMVSQHSEKSTVKPYNQVHAGMGLRASRSFENSGFSTQWSAYIFNDSFRTASLQTQYGLRMALGDTSNVRWSAAANANVLYKGINWQGDRGWTVVPSLDLIATYDKKWGMTLSHYPYTSVRNDTFLQTTTLKVHYQLGFTP